MLNAFLSFQSLFYEILKDANDSYFSIASNPKWEQGGHLATWYGPLEFRQRNYQIPLYHSM